MALKLTVKTGKCGVNKIRGYAEKNWK